MSSRSTVPATTALKPSVNSARTRGSGPVVVATRFITSTKFTCSRPGRFNALLKTLEEPPEHVKFFFATTEPGKIPITVLSRCQRYDFAGITPDQIATTLAEICESEQIKADPEALRTIARRASGSMRDAQSLLEQLLSFGGDLLTSELVHQQLGIASDERTLDLLDALSQRDAGGVLTLVDQAVASGVQPTELLGGTLEFLRDAMILAAGANASLLAATPRQRTRIKVVIDRWPLDTILTAQQILAEARSKLRGSPYSRLLVELALVRVARLESMTELSEVIARLASLESDGPASIPAEKKKALVLDPPQVSTPQPVISPAAMVPDWSIETIRAAYPGWIAGLDADFASKLSLVLPTSIFGPNQLVIAIERAYNWVADACDTNEVRPRIEAKLAQWLRRPIQLRFDRPTDEPQIPSRTTTALARDEALRDDPMIKQVVALFEARVVRIEVEEDATP